MGIITRSSQAHVFSQLDEAGSTRTMIHRRTREKKTIDHFTDTAAILISIVSNSHYGMPGGQIHINLPPGHPIMSFETIEIKMAAVSVKRSICIQVKRVSRANSASLPPGGSRDSQSKPWRNVVNQCSLEGTKDGQPLNGSFHWKYRIKSKALET